MKGALTIATYSACKPVASDCVVNEQSTVCLNPHATYPPLPADRGVGHSSPLPEGAYVCLSATSGTLTTLQPLLCWVQGGSALQRAPTPQNGHEAGDATPSKASNANMQNGRTALVKPAFEGTEPRCARCTVQLQQQEAQQHKSRKVPV